MGKPAASAESGDGVQNAKPPHRHHHHHASDQQQSESSAPSHSDVFQSLFKDLGMQAMAMESILRLVCGKVDKLEHWVTEVSFGMTELDLKLRNIAHNIEGTAANVDEDGAVGRWTMPQDDGDESEKLKHAAATVVKKVGVGGHKKKQMRMTGMVANILDQLTVVAETNAATESESEHSSTKPKKAKEAKKKTKPNGGETTAGVVSSASTTPRIDAAKKPKKKAPKPSVERKELEVAEPSAEMESSPAHEEAALASELEAADPDTPTPIVEKSMEEPNHHDAAGGEVPNCDEDRVLKTPLDDRVDADEVPHETIDSTDAQANSHDGETPPQDPMAVETEEEVATVDHSVESPNELEIIDSPPVEQQPQTPAEVELHGTDAVEDTASNEEKVAPSAAIVGSDEVHDGLRQIKEDAAPELLEPVEIPSKHDNEAVHDSPLATIELNVEMVDQQADSPTEEHTPALEQTSPPLIVEPDPVAPTTSLTPRAPESHTIDRVDTPSQQVAGQPSKVDQDLAIAEVMTAPSAHVEPSPSKLEPSQPPAQPSSPQSIVVDAGVPPPPGTPPKTSTRAEVAMLPAAAATPVEGSHTVSPQAVAVIQEPIAAALPEADNPPQAATRTTPVLAKPRSKRERIPPQDPTHKPPAPTKRNSRKASIRELISQRQPIVKRKSNVAAGSPSPQAIHPPVIEPDHPRVIHAPTSQQAADNHEGGNDDDDDDDDDEDDDEDDDDDDDEEDDEDDDDGSMSGDSDESVLDFMSTGAETKLAADASTAKPKLPTKMSRTLTALNKLKKANVLTPEETAELKQRATHKWFKLRDHVKEKAKKDVTNILLKRKKNIFTVSNRIELLEEKSREVYASIKQLNTEMKGKVELAAFEGLRRHVHDVQVSLQVLDQKLAKGSLPSMDNIRELAKELEALRATTAQQWTLAREHCDANHGHTLSLFDEHWSRVLVIEKTIEDKLALLAAESDEKLQQLPDYSESLETIRRLLRKKADLKVLKELEARVLGQETDEDCLVRCLSCHKEVLPDPHAADEVETIGEVDGGYFKRVNPGTASARVYRSNVPLNAQPLGLSESMPHLAASDPSVPQVHNITTKQPPTPTKRATRTDGPSPLSMIHVTATRALAMDVNRPISAPSSVVKKKPPPKTG